MKLTLSITTGALMLAGVVRSSKQTGPDCEVAKGVTLSFYGKADVSGPLAYPECGRINAGGRGTYDSPLSMASAPGAFGKCEIVFVPYLLKYVRFEDVCTECVKDWAKGKTRMQIWTGNDLSGGREQSDCERDLAPTHGMAVIRNPGSDYRLDTTPLYARGATSPCRMDHRYSLLNNDVFCYGRKEKTAGRRRKKKDKSKKMKPKAQEPLVAQQPQPQRKPPAVIELDEPEWPEELDTMSTDVLEAPAPAMPGKRSPLLIL